MKKNVMDMTLQEWRNIEKFHYFKGAQFMQSGVTYVFNDDEFFEFALACLQDGDDLFIEIQDTDCFYFANSEREQIYFFENLIAQEKFLGVA